MRRPKALPMWTFSVSFNKQKSYVLKKSLGNAALLAHEQLHLQIAEYLAEKAKANAPDFKDVSVKLIGVPTKTAKAEVTKALVAEVKKIQDAYIKTWGDLNTLVTDKYDANDAQGTDHGTKPVQQADWKLKYKQYVDAEAKAKGWTK